MFVHAKVACGIWVYGKRYVDMDEDGEVTCPECRRLRWARQREDDNDTDSALQAGKRNGAPGLEDVER